MRYPFGTITITEKSKQLVNDALNSGRVSNGKYVEEFEKKFAEFKERMVQLNPVFLAISSVTGQGLPELLGKTKEMLMEFKVESHEWGED